MERFNYRAGEEDRHLSGPRKILRVLCGHFEHQRRAQFEGGAAEPLRTITATFVRRRKKGVAEMAKKMMKRLREEVEKKGIKLSVNGNERETLDHQAEPGLSEELHEDCAQEVAASGCGAIKDVVSACSGDSSCGDVKMRRQMAAAAGKKSATSLSLFMEAFGLEVEEELSTLATQYWAEGVWIGTWHQEQKEAWMNQFRHGGR